jgi:hypothetical protein
MQGCVAFYNIYIYDYDLAGENLRNDINVRTFGGLMNEALRGLHGL